MRTWVILASIFADILDLTGVGHVTYFVDAAVIVLHLVYAGPRALIGILDMIPGVGMAPVFTVLASTYDRKAPRTVAEPAMRPMKNVTPPRGGSL